MKRIAISVLLICVVCSAYSQITQEMYDKKTEENYALKDSIKALQKDIRVEQENRKQMESGFQQTLAEQTKRISDMKAELDGLKKLKEQKKEIDALIKVQSDSIALLKVQLSDKDSQIVAAKQEGERLAQQENERGKQEILASIVNLYKDRPFDSLIVTSTQASVQRDLQILDGNTEVGLVLNDLQVYFRAKQLLSEKFDAGQVKEAMAQLNGIKRGSRLLDELKELLDYYQLFNDGLKDVIGKIGDLDLKESVKGMGREVHQMKLNKIMSEISSYIFNYDFNFVDYPYLSDIVLEIFKRKQPNADAGITDLLQKL